MKFWISIVTIFQTYCGNYIIIHLYSYVKVLLKNEHTANKFCFHLNFNFLKYFSFYFRNMNKC